MGQTLAGDIDACQYMPVTTTFAPLAVQLPVRVKGCCNDLAEPLPSDRIDALAAVMRALADPTRLQMVHMLSAASQPVCVCDFVAAFDLGQPTISHHLARLREAGIVASFKRGVWAFFTLRDDMPAAARRIVESLALPAVVTKAP
jgi:ArsR family transcriptional regulator